MQQQRAGSRRDDVGRHGDQRLLVGDVGDVGHDLGHRGGGGLCEGPAGRDRGAAGGGIERRRPADLVATLDAAAAAGFQEAASPGAIVGVRTPKGTWIKAYGDSDPTKKQAMTADMHVRIGSVTKPFTGTLIMQLVEQGKVSLDDPISTYVPGVPNGDQVTLKLLGTMRSGVASYSRNPDFVKDLFAKPESVFTGDQLLRFGYALSPAFAPGADFEYSNTNTLLLGKVVEKVTGKTLQEAYQSMVFDPLKLSQTSAPGSDPVMPAPFSRGYTLQGVTGTTPADATSYNPSWAGAAGRSSATPTTC